jgi:hypothetical protein
MGLRKELASMTTKQAPSESHASEVRSHRVSVRDGNPELEAMSVVFGALQALTPAEQGRVLSWVQEKLGVKAERRATAEFAAGNAATAPGNSSEPLQVSAKRFLAEKKPVTDVERVACLAYYQTHSKGKSKFKTRELTELNKEAAQPPLSNPAFAVVNATNAKYLAPAGGGQKQITVRGETLVEALPDRDKVKSALEANPLGRQKRSGWRASRGK